MRRQGHRHGHRRDHVMMFMLFLFSVSPHLREDFDVPVLSARPRDKLAAACCEREKIRSSVESRVEELEVQLEQMRGYTRQQDALERQRLERQRWEREITAQHRR